MTAQAHKAIYQHPADVASPVIDALGRVLADTYTLYLKTQNYHWNVTGPHFETLHAAFERQYGELASAVDVVAERIRSLGAPAPGSFGYFAERSSVKEARGVPAADEMVRDLANSHQIVGTAIKAALEAGEKAEDVVTVDLMTQRLAAHEKAVWMLNSFLG